MSIGESVLHRSASKPILREGPWRDTRRPVNPAPSVSRTAARSQLPTGSWPLASLLCTPHTDPRCPRSRVGSFLFALHIGASLNIIDCMSGKATALLGIVGAAAVGIYFKWRRPRRAPWDVIEPKGSVSFRSSRRIEITMMPRRTLLSAPDPRWSGPVSCTLGSSDT